MGKGILLAAGCSWTDQNFMSSDKSLSADNRGGWPMWPELIANRLNLQCINKGRSGASNEYIFNKVLDAIQIEKNIKLVVVMWSGWDRFMYLGENINPIAWVSFQNFEAHKELNNNLNWSKTYAELSLDNFFFNMDQKTLLKYTKRTIDDTLRYMFSLSSILKQYNIPYVFIQGVPPFILSYLHELKNIKFNYTSEMLFKDLLSSVYYKALSKDKNIIGFPFFKILNGYAIRNFMELEDAITPIDWHPNRNMQVKISNIIMDHINDRNISL